MKKASGGISKTMAFNAAYVILAVVVAVLSYFGYDQFTPDPMVAAAVSAVVIPVVNLILRKYFTSEPIA